MTASGVAGRAAGLDKLPLSMEILPWKSAARPRLTRGLALVLLAALPLATFAMPQDQARQLLLRSGFQPSAAEIAALQSQDWDASVDRIVDAAARQRTASTAPPPWIDDPIDPGAFAKADGAKRRLMRKQRADKQFQLQTWWLQEMAATGTPLTERMTMFWHNHFVSSLGKVKSPERMYRQDVLLRRYALGNYRELVHAIAHDPAMLYYLDASRNRKDQPNENFARELLELFTLGEGHYSEADVREAARAFTGWRFDAATGQFAFARNQHDDGRKNFLGRSGNFDGDDIIDIVLEQPQAARFIVAKLWREFVSPTPDPAAAERLAADFRKDYELAPLIKALFRQPAFADPRLAGTLVKSPVELVVGTQRFFALNLDPRLAVAAAASMGQSVLDPPNVRGWPGGDAWITSQTLLARRQFLLFLTGNATDIAPAPGGLGRRAEVRAAVIHDRNPLTRQVLGYAEQMPSLGSAPLLLPLAPVAPPPLGTSPTERIAATLLDPVYNLK